MAAEEGARMELNLLPSDDDQVVVVIKREEEIKPTRRVLLAGCIRCQMYLFFPSAGANPICPNCKGTALIDVVKNYEEEENLRRLKREEEEEKQKQKAEAEATI